MNNIFNLFNNLQRRERNRVEQLPNNALTRQRVNDLVFGEETQPFFFNNRGEKIHNSQFGAVKTLAQDITLQFYGEQKFVQMVTSVYGELFKSRVAQGFTGMKGMNMKTIICAILYLIMMYEEKTKINVDKLLRCANNVKSSTRTKINDKMFYRSVDTVLSHLSTYRDDVNAHERFGDVDFNIDQDIRRFAISLGYQTKDVNKIRQLLKDVPQPVKNSHSSSVIASCIIYKYVHMHESKNRIMEAEKILKLTSYVRQNVLPKFMKTRTNISLKMN